MARRIALSRSPNLVAFAIADDSKGTNVERTFRRPSPGWGGLWRLFLAVKARVRISALESGVSRAWSGRGADRSRCRNDCRSDCRLRCRCSTVLTCTLPWLTWSPRPVPATRVLAPAACAVSICIAPRPACRSLHCGCAETVAGRRMMLGVPDAPRRHVSETDPALLWSVLGLLAFGLVMVYSASIATAEVAMSTGFQPAYFLVRYTVFVGIGLVVAAVAFQVPVDRPRRNILPIRSRLAPCCWWWC